MILLDATESRELDRIGQEKYGIPSYLLMRMRARPSPTRSASARRGGHHALVVAGKGNNGGDGFVAAEA